VALDQGGQASHPGRQYSSEELTASAMVISGGPDAAPEAATRACRSGLAKNFWKSSAVSYSSTTSTKPSPTANR
jgi:hypothetical protein